MTALHEYPTPLTDAVAAHKDDMGQPWAKTLLRMLDHARELERRLALCRDALDSIVALGQAMPEPSEETEIAIAALDATR